MSANADQAIEWLNTNHEWAVYVAEGAPARAAEAFPHLDAAEQVEVWDAVRTHLGLAHEVVPGHAGAQSDVRPVTPETPAGIGPSDPSADPRGATSQLGPPTAVPGQGSPQPTGGGELPSEDGWPGGNTSAGVAFRFGTTDHHRPGAEHPGDPNPGTTGDHARDGHSDPLLQMNGVTANSNLFHNQAVAPTDAQQWRLPSVDGAGYPIDHTGQRVPDPAHVNPDDLDYGQSQFMTNPWGAGSDPADNPLDGQLHATPEQFGAQWEALEAFHRENDALQGAIVGHQPPNDLHPAIQLVLEAAQEVMTAAQSHQGAATLANARVLWDTCPDLDAAHQDAWTQAATSIEESAGHAYDTWLAYSQDNHELMHSDAVCLTWAEHLAQWADEAHRELTNTIHAHAS